MKKFILIIILAGIGNQVYSQQATFSQVYYDSLFTFQGFGIVSKKVIEAMDEGYIITGKYDEYDPKGLLIKIDTLGNVVWNKTYDISPAASTIEFSNIIATHDSNYIVVGNLYDMNINSGSALCMKIDINGNIIWATTITHGPFNIYNILDVVETSEYDIILTGHYDALLIAKIDSNGNLKWSNLYQLDNYENIGFSVKQFNDIYIVGGFKHQFPPSNTSGFLIYIDSTGAPITAKSIKLLTGYVTPMGLNFLVKNNRLVILIENSLAEIDTSGNIYWYQVYNPGSYSCFDCNGNQLKSSLDGGFIFTSYNEFGWGGYIIKTDSIGNLLWMKQIENRTIDVLSLVDTTYLVLGNGPLYGIKTTQSTPVAHFGVVKTDSIGNNSMCSGNQSLIPVSDNLIISNTQFTYQQGAFSASILPTISSINIFYLSSCVDFVSNIADYEWQNYINVHPNPASDYINFEFTEKISVNASISIYNLVGEIIYKYKIVNVIPTHKIDVTNLKNGYYLWEFSSDGYTQRGKFIKQ